MSATTARAPRTHRIVSALWHQSRTHPTTAISLAVYLVIGVATAALWDPVASRPWFTSIAYGVPAFEAGRWWTPITGAFVSLEPWHYGISTILIIVGLGMYERRHGSVRTFVAFWIGQVGGVLAAAAFVDALRLTGLEWPTRLGGTLDVGPSCGLVVVLALAIASLRSPWRFRGRLLMTAALLVLLLLDGSLADVEHAIAGGAILAFGFGRSTQRATAREWRVVAFASMAAIGVFQLVLALVPTDGPLGSTRPGPAVWSDIAIDLIITVLLSRWLLTGRRWAWIVALALASFNVAEFVVVMTLLDGQVLHIPGAGVAIAASILWLMAGVLLILGRSAFTVPFIRRGPFVAIEHGDVKERLIRVLTRHGGGTLSWMATWPRMRVLFGPDDAWAVPVRKVGGVAIALGDPIGPREAWPEAVAAFTESSIEAGLRPCFFSASPALVEAAGPEWRSLSVGEDTIVDLPGLEFTGGAWQPVRGAANRAQREGITFRMSRLHQESFAVLAQVRAISESWVGDKGLPEMGFTLGGVEEALDPHVRIALALDDEGSVHGVLSWLPIYGPAHPDGSERIRGWVLDVMRRRDGGFPPVMEFLIGQSLLTFRDEGAEFASLSGAPLAHGDDGDDAEEGALDRILESIASVLEPAYGFASLHRFKQKFHPRTVSMRLVYLDEAALPAIGAAITRAYLPDATPSSLVRSGLSLVKH